MKKETDAKKVLKLLTCLFLTILLTQGVLASVSASHSMREERFQQIKITPVQCNIQRNGRIYPCTFSLSSQSGFVSHPNNSMQLYGTAWRFSLGYQFLDFFGLEAEHVHYPVAGSYSVESPKSGYVNKYNSFCSAEGVYQLSKRADLMARAHSDDNPVDRMDDLASLGVTSLI